MYNKALYLLKSAVTAFLGNTKSSIGRSNRRNANNTVSRDRAVEISVHYTALFRSHYCNLVFILSFVHSLSAH